MIGREQRDNTRRPWHLWLVAIAVFALYIGGARDYLLILIWHTEYIRAQFGSHGMAYFTDYPPTLRLVWAINILGGLIAPMLLFARSRWALPTAGLTATAQVVLLGTTFVFFDRWAMLGVATSLFDIGVGVVTVLVAGYCWMMRRRGVLT